MNVRQGNGRSWIGRVFWLLGAVLFVGTTILYGQDFDRWLHAPPGRATEYLKSADKAETPRGYAFPTRFQGWGKEVQRFCRELAADQIQAVDVEEPPSGPTLSETHLLQGQLLEAAILASQAADLASMTDEMGSGSDPELQGH